MTDSLIVKGFLVFALVMGTVGSGPSATDEAAAEKVAAEEAAAEEAGDR